MKINMKNVSQNVYDGIMAVRDGGLTNMLDRNMVINLCEEMGYDEAAEWVKLNKSSYASGIFEGFEVETLIE